MAVNLKIKLQQGTGGDLDIQNMDYYRNYIINKSKMAKTMRLPCFLISVAGEEPGSVSYSATIWFILTSLLHDYRFKLQHFHGHLWPKDHCGFLPYTIH